MPQNELDILLEIKRSKICQYLASSDNGISNLFNGGVLTDRIPRLLYLTRKDLEWGYTNFNGESSLSDIATFNYTLCGKYRAAADRKIGNATGIVVGTSEQAEQLILPRGYPQIIVGKAGSIIENGDTEFTINDADAAPNGKIAAWAFVEGNLVDDADATITDQMTIQPQWIAGMGYSFTLENGATFQTGQVVKLQYPVFQNLSVPIGTSGTQDLSFYATLNGNETKDLKNTKGQYFLVPMNAFEVVQFTLFCVSDTGERLSLVWRGSIYNNAGTMILYEESRTVIGANPFGDAFVLAPPDGTLIVAGSDSFQSIIVTMTGITDKVIQCEAKFIFSSSSI